MGSRKTNPVPSELRAIRMGNHDKRRTFTSVETFQIDLETGGDSGGGDASA